MTNRNKTLGTGLENRVVAKALAAGLTAHKQPLSGVLKEYPNDVVVEYEDNHHRSHGLLGECKVRSTHPSYTEMQEWLEKAQTNAKRVGLEGAFLTYNVKGSRTPRVLLDLDLFFSLLSSTKVYS